MESISINQSNIQQYGGSVSPDWRLRRTRIFTQCVSNQEAYGLHHLALRTKVGWSIWDKLIYADYAAELIRTDSFNGKKRFFVKELDCLPIEIRE